MEGLEYETIAEILNIPGGTVRSRLHRARMQLRDYEDKAGEHNELNNLVATNQTDYE